MPRIESFPRNITYIRLYDLSQDLDSIDGHLADGYLIIDLRFVDSDLEQALALGSRLASHETTKLETTGSFSRPDGLSIEPLNKSRKRTTPIIVLTNSATAGPIEAVLDALQAKDQIIVAGTRTAGRTGQYRRIDNDPPFYVITGELHASGRDPLVGTGFTPKIVVDVDSAKDDRAYHALERGTPIDQLVAFHLKESNNENGNSNGSNGTNTLEDVILQRAVNIIVALQVIGTL